jgi:hypothetical protein
MFEGDPKCISEQIIPYQFKDYYSCIRAGYQSAYESYNSLAIKEINKNKIAVKIECKELQGV